MGSKVRGGCRRPEPEGGCETRGFLDRRAHFTGSWLAADGRALVGLGVGMSLRHVSRSMRRALDAGTLKAAISPTAFYRGELPTAPAWKRGAVWVDGGLCPFHADRHAGSFRVNLDSGAFRCFACGASGADILAFVQLRDGLKFPDALAKLAREWGV